MKKKGFTLIELLAVIVILAIIALIATPIVMNVIENSRKGAAERSAENYLDAVETAVGTERLDGEVLEGEYTINSDGNLVKDGKTINIDMSGNKPKSGTIYIENGQVTTSSTMKIGDYKVSYNAGKKAYVAGIPQPICTYVAETGTTKETRGAKYTCDLDTPRTFYVLENIESSDNISLIMDRNFTDDTVDKSLAWCIDEGTITTCKNINSKEDNPLKHIQDTFGNEVEVSIPTTSQLRVRDKFLCDNLNEDTYEVDGIDGYCTADTVYSDESHRVAWKMCVNGNAIEYKGVGSNSGDVGVRPVITISKDQLN